MIDAVIVSTARTPIVVTMGVGGGMGAAGFLWSTVR
jgi:hypothetical protein